MAQPHEVLGVAENADEAAINAAFRRAAKKYHPDLNGGDPSGTRRMRRAIAAREFLMKRKRRNLDPGKVMYRLPLLRERWSVRNAASTFALAGAISLILIPVVASQWGGTQAKVSVVPKASISAKIESIPDAGSAEIKAIRDVREAWNYSPLTAQMEMEPEPLLQPAAKHRHSTQLANGLRKAIDRAAFLMSKTFRRLAAE